MNPKWKASFGVSEAGGGFVVTSGEKARGPMGTILEFLICVSDTPEAPLCMGLTIWTELQSQNQCCTLCSWESFSEQWELFCATKGLRISAWRGMSNNCWKNGPRSVHTLSPQEVTSLYFQVYTLGCMNFIYAFNAVELMGTLQSLSGVGGLVVQNQNRRGKGEERGRCAARCRPRLFPLQTCTLQTVSRIFAERSHQGFTLAVLD